jgi:hypothetical protein
MLISPSYPIQTEIDYLQLLIDQGIEVTHIQLGGEYWGARYFYGDTQDPKVVERITIDDYLAVLDRDLSAVETAFPDAKISLLGCSHTAEEAERNTIIAAYDFDTQPLVPQLQANLAGSTPTNTYRVVWNQAVAKYIADAGRADDWAMTIHYYAGAKEDLQLPNNEEAIFEGINWDPFISQIRALLPTTQIIVPESGWYPSDRSQEQLDKMVEFYESGVTAIGENGIMGLHVLHQSSVAQLNWYSNSGTTAIGTNFIKYFNEVNQVPDPDVPVLVELKESIYSTSFSNKPFSILQRLWFSDGSFYFNKVYPIFGRGWRFTQDDVGKPITYFIELKR